jgi:hypothetical protein
MVTSLFGGLADVLRININLFKGLAKYWEYMPSYTQRTLTGVSWSKAQPMLANDRLLGLQAGTTANMYTNLAYQQADLYTSGKFNEDQLVAAARLGIFDLAYAAPGGDIEAQQAGIYDRLYRSLYESGADKATIQSQLSLIRQYNPNMASYLERGHGLVEAGYKQYRSFGAFSDTRDNMYLGERENARVSMASSGWDMNLRSFREGASLLGAKAYEWSEPVIKAVERALWAVARGESIDWNGIKTELGKLWNKVFGDVDFKNINWQDKLSFIDPILDAIKNKLVPWGAEIATAFIEEMRMVKIKFDWKNLWSDFKAGKEIQLGNYFEAYTGNTAAHAGLKGAEKTWARAAEMLEDSATYANAGAASSWLNLSQTPNNKWVSQSLWGSIVKRLGGSENIKGVAQAKGFIEGVYKNWDKGDIKGSFASLGLALSRVKEEVDPTVYAVLHELANAQLQREVASNTKLGQSLVDAGIGVFDAATNTLKIVVEQKLEVNDQTQHGIMMYANKSKN